MAQSLAKVLVHIIFSTKCRQRLLTKTIREELHAYLVGTLRNLDSPAILVNSVEDHVHILCSLSRKYAISKLLEETKKESSKWIKTKGASFRGFHWQNGYGVFSVSQSRLEATRRYIAEQEKHHRRMSFQEEFRRFLDRHQIPYDERYVWD